MTRVRSRNFSAILAAACPCRECGIRVRYNSSVVSVTSHPRRDGVVSRRVVLERQLQTAVARRDRLLARATWWDRWRTTMMLPLLGAGAAAGYLVAWIVQRAVRLPPWGDAVGAIVGILVVGRVVTRAFDVSRLAAAERRVADLERRVAALADEHS
jgi:hypothetical protein